jgi:hypothetical protein
MTALLVLGAAASDPEESDGRGGQQVALVDVDHDSDHRTLADAPTTSTESRGATTTSTTDAPTTTTPPSAPPTTAPPTTAPPTTAPPTTAPPVTAAPLPPPPPTIARAPEPAGCTPGYDPCIPPTSDADCAGGSGNGPTYVSGPVFVSGSDPYDLDSDNDGVGCES